MKIVCSLYLGVDWDQNPLRSLGTKLLLKMLPDSIPESLWAEFRLMRKKIKHPMTEYAEKLILAKLERWRIESGADPKSIIEESIERGWSGVFLNGHGKEVQDAANVRPDTIAGVASAQIRCCTCGKPLQSGFIWTGKGKRCHEC